MVRDPVVNRRTRRAFETESRSLQQETLRGLRLLRARVAAGESQLADPRNTRFLRGNIRHRIKAARASTGRGQSWDHFSWYGVPNGNHEQEIEALLLRMLPLHLRILNKQLGELRGAKKHAFEDEKPDPINRPNIFGR